MSTRPIRFYHRGAVQEVSGVPPTLTVLDWLRQQARLTGTKEGCNEGDCGACTVMVGELVDGAVRLRAMNACLQFMPTLDGKALLTVEDVGTASDPSPVQQALVDCHGSQCGFCTPGFVMSLTAEYERHGRAGTRPDRAQLADALAGNLCRCTGYRPILDAGERMFELPTRHIDLEPIASALRLLASDGALHYDGPDAAGHTVDGLPAMQSFHGPRTVEQLAALKAANPDARLLAGATDIALWSNKQLRDLGPLIHVSQVPELRTIVERDGVLEIGAGAALEDAWAALARHMPSLTEVWRRFASPPVRHAGTMGGNVANGSPIGDSAPVLMALDASLVLRRGSQQREVALKDFYLGYMVNALQPGEFIERIRVPLPATGTIVRAWKISKRYDSDISTLCLGVALKLSDGHVSHVRLAFGGMAATVKRAEQAEAVLLGQAWTSESVEAAIAALSREFQPLSDLRASAAYRRRVAGNLLRRLWLQTRPEDPIASTGSRVWPLAALETLP